MPHDLDEGRDPRGIVSHRRQLINGTAGVDLPIGERRLRFSNVPLFKAENDALKQAIRVRVPGGPGAPLTIRISANGTVLDETDIAPNERDGSHYLLVPEVEKTTLALIEVLEASAVVTSAPFEIEPQRKFTVHLLHHSHYDIGYTDTQSMVLESQLSFIDSALELCTVTDDWPDDAKFRWNIEVNWPLKHWLRTRPASARAELKRRIEEGRIEVHALPFSMHTEAYAFDELAKQLDFTAELRREHGIPVESAIQSDVPGCTIGLSTLLTDAGVRTLTVAHNYAGRSIPFLNDGQELTRPFYWEAPDGEKLIVWYTDTLFGNAYMEAVVLGISVGYDDVLSSLPEYLSALVQRPYPYGEGDWLAGDLRGVELTKTPYPYDILHMRVQSAFADNAAPALTASEIARRFNGDWAFPRLRVSISHDFFSEVEATLADRLDTFRGDWTDWWADGIGSAAIALGANRQSQNDLRQAQTLNALADVLTDEPNPLVAPETERAYEEMALFDEHTWGAANPWNAGLTGFQTGAHEWVRKEAFAYSAGERTASLLSGGLQRIAALGAGSQQAADAQPILVFNPSSWIRTDLVRVFVPERSLTEPALDLIDASSGEPVAYVIEEQTNPNHRPRGRFLHFLARDLPAFGYARYWLVPGQGAASAVPRIRPDIYLERPNFGYRRRVTTTGEGGASAGASAGTAISTDALALEFDLASVSVGSLTERSSGRELIAGSAPFGFNTYIYDEYTSAPAFNHLTGRIPGADLWLLGSRSQGQYALVTHRESNDVWERIIVRYSGHGADWLEASYTLPHGLSRLLISNRLHKPATMTKESVYFAFPFAAEEATLTFEITGGVGGAHLPHVPGSADYFRAIRHWATVESPGVAPIAWATGEAPLVQTGNIRIPYGPFVNTIPDDLAHPATIYSWALNNIWDTNFPPKQGGEMRFRYAIGVGGDDATALGRETGAAVAHPLLGVATPLGANAVADAPDRGSFAVTRHPLIEVSHIAPAREGGLAVFLQSLAAERVETTLEIGLLTVAAAKSGNFLEEELTPAVVRGNAIEVGVDAGELRAVVIDVA